MIRFHLCLCLALLALMPIHGSAQTIYRVKIIKVIDGDTLLTDRTSFGFPQKARIRGIDTGETSPGRAKCPLEVERGLAAKAFLSDLVKRAGMRAVLKNATRDAYADRHVFDVWLSIGGKRVDVRLAMIEAGHAKRYEPIRDKEFKKPDWCDGAQP